MKKKGVAVLILAAALAVQPMCVYGAKSPSFGTIGGGGSGGGGSSGGGGGGGGGGGSVSGGSSSNSTVTVSDSGVKTTGATTSSGPGGSTIGVAVDTTTTTGEQVTTNSKGEAVIGDTAVTFANGPGEQTAGLPESVAAAIQDINNGKNLNEAVNDVDLSGYNALTGTHAIITKDAATDAVKTGPVEVTLYVPNLVDGLGTVEVLFYDNATGTWKLLPAVKVDPVTKTVAVNIPGSGTLSVVYKK